MQLRWEASGTIMEGARPRRHSVESLSLRAEQFDSAAHTYRQPDRPPDHDPGTPVTPLISGRLRLPATSVLGSPRRDPPRTLNAECNDHGMRVFALPELAEPLHHRFEILPWRVRARIVN